LKYGREELSLKPNGGKDPEQGGGEKLYRLFQEKKDSFLCLRVKKGEAQKERESDEGFLRRKGSGEGKSDRRGFLLEDSNKL